MRTLIVLAGLVLAAAAALAQPRLLSETGLGAPGVMAFSPQYPLWTDGTLKRRWIRLPPGTTIDARRPDAWRFPPGTRLWKEFADDATGRPLETRFIERLPDGRWRYAAYVWRADGRDAELAPAGGAFVPRPGTGDGRHAVPSRADCEACHAGGATPVLGFSALQLSPDRDPLAPHASVQAGSVDLAGLLRQGLLAGWPAGADRAPRIEAATPQERAARGYLHGNCGHCHQPAGVPVPLSLAMPGGQRPPPSLARRLVQRMASRQPLEQMPPLGTRVVDAQGLAMVKAWLDAEAASPSPTDDTHSRSSP